MPTSNPGGREQPSEVTSMIPVATAQTANEAAMTCVVAMTTQNGVMGKNCLT